MDMGSEGTSSSQDHLSEEYIDALTELRDTKIPENKYNYDYRGIDFLRDVPTNEDEEIYAYEVKKVLLKKASRMRTSASRDMIEHVEIVPSVRIKKVCSGSTAGLFNMTTLIDVKKGAAAVVDLLKELDLLRPQANLISAANYVKLSKSESSWYMIQESSSNQKTYWSFTWARPNSECYIRTALLTGKHPSKDLNQYKVGCAIITSQKSPNYCVVCISLRDFTYNDGEAFICNFTNKLRGQPPDMIGPQLDKWNKINKRMTKTLFGSLLEEGNKINERITKICPIRRKHKKCNKRDCKYMHPKILASEILKAEKNTEKGPAKKEKIRTLEFG